MKSRLPASMAPTGQPRPFEKSIQTESKPFAWTRAGTPLATTAFIRRAPSMWVATPWPWALATTSRSIGSGQTRPPAALAVCSTDTRRVRGKYRLSARTAARTAAPSKVPGIAPLPAVTARSITPASAAGPPPS